MAIPPLGHATLLFSPLFVYSHIYLDNFLMQAARKLLGLSLLAVPRGIHDKDPRSRRKNKERANKEQRHKCNLEVSNAG